MSRRSRLIRRRSRATRASILGPYPTDDWIRRLRLRSLTPRSAATVPTRADGVPRARAAATTRGSGAPWRRSTASVSRPSRASKSAVPIASSIRAPDSPQMSSAGTCRSRTSEAGRPSTTPAAPGRRRMPQEGWPTGPARRGPVSAPTMTNPSAPIQTRSTHPSGTIGCGRYRTAWFSHTHATSGCSPAGGRYSRYAGATSSVMLSSLPSWPAQASANPARPCWPGGVRRVAVSRGSRARGR